MPVARGPWASSLVGAPAPTRPQCAQVLLGGPPRPTPAHPPSAHSQGFCSQADPSGARGLHLAASHPAHTLHLRNPRSLLKPCSICKPLATAAHSSQGSALTDPCVPPHPATLGTSDGLSSPGLGSLSGPPPWERVLAFSAGARAEIHLPSPTRCTLCPLLWLKPLTPANTPPASISFSPGAYSPACRKANGGRTSAVTGGSTDRSGGLLGQKARNAPRFFGFHGLHLFSPLELQSNPHPVPPPLLHARASGNCLSCRGRGRGRGIRA